jgi:predicted small secreted protein
MRGKSLAILLIASSTLTACKTSGVKDAVASTGSTVANAASGVPSLVSVNLSNVLNDLALDLNLDRANIPVNAQIPITLAANICGVSINILSASTGGQANCTANTSSPELAQVVQQQIAAGGNVGGGSQGGSTAGTSTTGTTSGTTSTTSSTPTTNGTATTPSTTTQQ